MFPSEFYHHYPALRAPLALHITNMIERIYIPGALKHLFVAPLDKPGKDPGVCNNKRPIALLNPLMKLVELVIVRRLLPLVEHLLSADQYAYQRARSTEILLSDLDYFVTTNRARNRITYVAGLDIAGAFDSVSYVKLLETLKYYRLTLPPVRFIGGWLTRRVFRVRLMTPLGVAYSGYHDPTRGVPQGGNLSPLLWILYINRLTASAMSALRGMVPYPEGTWSVIVQTFADDVSAAVGHNCRKAAIHIAWVLRRVLLDLLKKLGLEISLPQCTNFLAECLSMATRLYEDSISLSASRGKVKEQNIKRMLSDLERLTDRKEVSEESDTVELPFTWKFNFRLLGVMLDCQWTFREHVAGLMSKAVRRMAVLNRAGNATWGLESRISAITAHSLVESVVSYGLAVYGVHISQADGRRIDTGLLTRVSRRIVGTGPTARREILHALADAKSFNNHYIQKSANVLDRVLCSTGTSARLATINFLHKHYHINSLDATYIQNTYWTSLPDGRGSTIEATSNKEIAEHNTLTKLKYKDNHPGLSWMIKQTRNQNIPNTTKQSSVYLAMDETLLMDTQAAHLHFHKDTQKQGYRVGLEILQVAGWTPSVVYDAPLFIAPGKNALPVNWENIKWCFQDPADTEKGTEEVSAHMIRTTCLIVPSGALVACLTVIETRHNQEWRQGIVLGEKFNKELRHLRAECLLASLQLLRGWLEQESAGGPIGERQRIHLKICCAPPDDWNGSGLDRWKQYGTPPSPIPQQSDMNDLLGCISHTAGISLTSFHSLRESGIQAAESLAKSAGRQIESILHKAGDISEKIPTFWAPQKEVKEMIKQQQEEHEHKVLEHLSDQTENQSFSSGIYLHWGLTRAANRAVFRPLADNRVLQTTFGNMICATRFKTLEHNRLVTTKCPKCGTANSWGHNRKCYGLVTPKCGAEKKWQAEVKDYLKKIITEQPAMPDPAEKPYITQEVAKGLPLRLKNRDASQNNPKQGGTKGPSKPTC